jgi:hypothetical protein
VFDSEQALWLLSSTYFFYAWLGLAESQTDTVQSFHGKRTDTSRRIAIKLIIMTINLITAAIVLR